MDNVVEIMHKEWKAWEVSVTMDKVRELPERSGISTGKLEMDEG